MSIKVRAKEMGFYGGSRRREGAVFEIEDESKLGMWMDKLESSETVDEETKDSKGITLGDYNQEPTEDDVKHLGGQAPKIIEKAKKRKSNLKG